MDKLKSPTSTVYVLVEGGGAWGAFLQIDLLGYDFGRYLFFYDNAPLKPHEYFKVGVQACCGVTDCYMPIYVS